MNTNNTEIWKISVLWKVKKMCVFFFFSGVMRIYANDEDSLYPSEYTEMLSDQGLCLCWSFTAHPDLCELPESIDIFFIIFQKKHMLWYSLEVPQWGTSNEYPQHLLLLGIKKTIYLLVKTKAIRLHGQAGWSGPSMFTYILRPLFACIHRTTLFLIIWLI